LVYVPDTRREARRKSQWPESGSEMGLITQWTEIAQQPPTGFDRRWDRGTVGSIGDGTVGLIAQWPENITANHKLWIFSFSVRSEVTGLGLGDRFGLERDAREGGFGSVGAAYRERDTR
jgi:hypothetical protein